MGVTRCKEPGCGRFSGKNEQFCRKHRNDATGAAVETGSNLPDLSSDEVNQAAKVFQRRLMEGDYRQLFGDSLNDVIQQAAEEPGLSDEIGILRVVLARILIEERDPAQLAESIARVAGVAIQAARAQRAISGEKAAGFSTELIEILTKPGWGTIKEVGA